MLFSKSCIGDRGSELALLYSIVFLRNRIYSAVNEDNLAVKCLGISYWVISC